MSKANGLPTGWAWSNMVNACTKIQDGTHFSPDKEKQLPAGKYPYVTAKNVRPWGLDLGDIAYLSEVDHRSIYRRCDPAQGDVLLVKDGVNAGDAAINSFEGEMSLLSSVCMLRPHKELLLSQFLRYFLLSPQGYRWLTGQMTGTAIKRIILQRIREAPVPIAPLREQRRIVAKIEELFSDLDAGVAALRRAKANLKRYRAAALKAAVEGKLTEQWRDEHSAIEPASKLLERILAERRKKWEADQLAKLAAAGKEPPKNWRARYVEPAPPDTVGVPDLPEGWCWVSMEQLVERSEYGTSVKCDYRRSGIPVLRIPNIAGGEINLTDLKHATKSLELNDGDELLPGDMLMCRTNGSIALIGKAAVVRDTLGHRFSFASYLLRFRFYDAPILASWIHLYVSSTFGRRFIERNAASSAGQHNISLSLINRMPVPLAPRAERETILANVDERLSVVSFVETAQTRQLIRASRLRQSILKQAFEGKLVPQDPKDVPASMILERIGISHALETPNRNGRASTRPISADKKSRTIPNTVTRQRRIRPG